MLSLLLLTTGFGKLKNFLEVHVLIFSVIILGKKLRKLQGYGVN